MPFPATFLLFPTIIIVISQHHFSLLYSFPAIIFSHDFLVSEFQLSQKRTYVTTTDLEGEGERVFHIVPLIGQQCLHASVT